MGWRSRLLRIRMACWRRRWRVAIDDTWYMSYRARANLLSAITGAPVGFVHDALYFDKGA